MIVYTVSEVATLLKCNDEFIRRLIREKRLRAFKHGVEWRIEGVDLDVYIRENKNIS